MRISKEISAPCSGGAAPTVSFAFQGVLHSCKIMRRGSFRFNFVQFATEFYRWCLPVTVACSEILICIMLQNNGRIRLGLSPALQRARREIAARVTDWRVCGLARARVEPYVRTTVRVPSYRRQNLQYRRSSTNQ